MSSIRKVRRAEEKGSLIAIIGDEDTVTGFLLAGTGDATKKDAANFMIVHNDTPLVKIEETFRAFAKREDISLILITKTIADEIRPLVAEHTAAIPCILEIPSKGEGMV